MTNTFIFGGVCLNYQDIIKTMPQLKRMILYPNKERKCCIDTKFNVRYPSTRKIVDEALHCYLFGQYRLCVAGLYIFLDALFKDCLVEIGRSITGRDGKILALRSLFDRCKSKSIKLFGHDSTNKIIEGIINKLIYNRNDVLHGNTKQSILEIIEILKYIEGWGNKIVINKDIDLYKEFLNRYRYLNEKGLDRFSQIELEKIHGEAMMSFSSILIKCVSYVSRCIQYNVCLVIFPIINNIFKKYLEFFKYTNILAFRIHNERSPNWCAEFETEGNLKYNFYIKNNAMLKIIEELNTHHIQYIYDPPPIKNVFLHIITAMEM
jgi:hypothetical protein